MMQPTIRIAVFIFSVTLLVLLSGNFFFSSSSSLNQQEKNTMAFRVLLRDGINGGFAGPTIK